MTHYIFIMTLAFMAGTGIGIFYFSGLWWTLKRLPRVKKQALWMLGSFWVRTAACLVLFYLVMGGEAERLLAALLGFMGMRLLFSRWLRPEKKVSGFGFQVSAKPSTDH